jgi:5-methylcytosine-specific restriction endonuclease McrA
MSKMNSKQKQSRKSHLANVVGFGSCCFWCERLLPLDLLTLDHLIPTSKGGSNNMENLRLSCRHCNQSRGNSLFPPAQRHKSSSLNNASK